MKFLSMLCVGGVLLLAGWGCLAKTPSAKPAPQPPPAKQATKDTPSKSPQWKELVQQATFAERKGNATKAHSLLDKAYKEAPDGNDKAQVALQIAGLYERQKQFAEARRWYLEAIYAAPKGPLAGQARERMRALPDSRRPAAAGATPAGGAPKRSTKPK